MATARCISVRTPWPWRRLTRRITYLQDGDWAVLTADGVKIFDADNKPAQREIRQTAQSGALIGKDGYRHFMHKEIHEQPQVIGDTLNTMLNLAEGTLTLPELPFDLKDVTALTIIACGTSYYAGLVAKYWIETIARLPVEIDVASEFRYRSPPMKEGGLALFISQSPTATGAFAPARDSTTTPQNS